VTTSEQAVEGPPSFLQVVGHPVRWNILSELARSDRTVQELVGLVGEAQNLVSYHLGKLKVAGLVVARRSSADGRDVYYTSNLARFGELLSDAGAALHPALRLSPSSSVDGPGQPTRILFLCTGNSARSQIAEALVAHRSPGTVQAASAGSAPKPLHPNALRVMRELYDIDLSGNEPKHLSQFAHERFDWVIRLCDKVREVCPDYPGNPEVVHWSIPDPSAETDGRRSMRAFRELASELDMRIGFLLAAIAEGEPSPIARRRSKV
jgi:protein-tyrosine-phosphatase